jgi:hypothetical protein
MSAPADAVPVPAGEAAPGRVRSLLRKFSPRAAASGQGVKDGFAGLGVYRVPAPRQTAYGLREAREIIVEAARRPAPRRTLAKLREDALIHAGKIELLREQERQISEELAGLEARGKTASGWDLPAPVDQDDLKLRAYPDVLRAFRSDLRKLQRALDEDQAGIEALTHPAPAPGAAAESLLELIDGEAGRELIAPDKGLRRAVEDLALVRWRGGASTSDPLVTLWDRLESLPPGRSGSRWPSLGWDFAGMSAMLAVVATGWGLARHLAASAQGPAALAVFVLGMLAYAAVLRKKGRLAERAVGLTKLGFTLADQRGDAPLFRVAPFEAPAAPQAEPAGVEEGLDEALAEQEAGERAVEPRRARRL